MITLAKVRSWALENALRILKVEQYGVKSPVEAAPFGDDSGPIENMTAIYADTAENGEPVVIGYINENQMADVGEKRLYSLDSEGNLSTFIWLKNNGTIEIAGDAHSTVRYSPLNQELQSAIMSLNQELVLIASGIAAGGGSYSPTPIQLDISGSENSDVKIS